MEEQTNQIKLNNEFEKDFQNQMNELINIELFFNKKELIDDGHYADDDYRSIKNEQNINEPKSLSIHSVEENNEVKLNKNNKVKEKEKNIESKRKFLVYHFFTPKISEEKKEEKNINNTKENNKDKKEMFFISKKRRKEMSDNILKKIKSHFFKFIKQIIKERIKKYNNKDCNFKFNQKKFIVNISVKENKSIWEEKFSDFIEKKIEKIEKDNKKDDKKDDIEYVLEYVRNDKIGQMTLEDLFKEYLNSKEFEDNVNKVRNEKNVNQDYINKYILKTKDFINHYKEGNNRPKKSLKILNKNDFIPSINDINIFDDSIKSIDSNGISLNEVFNLSPLPGFDN